MRDELNPLLKQHNGGISEFTFAGLFLFRKAHQYRISKTGPETIVIHGRDADDEYALLPTLLPEPGVLGDLMEKFKSFKGVSEPKAVELQAMGFVPREDRNNFDYIYLREDLAKLPGKKYHKKRNLVQGFLNNYTSEGKPLLRENIPQALEILDLWQKEVDGKTDYDSAKEALELFSELALCGAIYYVGGKPAAYIMGEELEKSRSYVIHFEKAVTAYKGIYQFVNKSFSALLPEKYEFINREQDLGDEGLRQAKMSYRPHGLVKKYRVGM